jgi:hypothetical protein
LVAPMLLQPATASSSLPHLQKETEVVEYYTVDWYVSGCRRRNVAISMQMRRDGCESGLAGTATLEVRRSAKQPRNVTWDEISPPQTIEGKLNITSFHTLCHSISWRLRKQCVNTAVSLQ